VPDEASRRQFGVALDEDERRLGLGGDGTQQRGLARAGRTLEQDVRAGVEGRDEQFDFAGPADDVDRARGSFRSGLNRSGSSSAPRTRSADVALPANGRRRGARGCRD